MIRSGSQGVADQRRGIELGNLGHRLRGREDLGGVLPSLRVGHQPERHQFLPVSTVSQSDFDHVYLIPDEMEIP